MRRPLLAALAALALLAGCATRRDAPACRGESFALNPVELPR